MAKNQKSTTQDRKKKYKGIIAILSATSAAGITASVVAPLVILANQKSGGDTPVTPEEQKSHTIEITQTAGWTISGPSSAKKGDTVQFTVVPSTSNTQATVPSAIVIKKSNYELTKKTDSETYVTEEIVWPYIEQVAAELSTKVESSETVGVVFDLNGGILVSGQTNDVKRKGCKLSEINVPSFSAPAGKEFLGWSIDGTKVITDYTFTANTTLTALYKTKTTSETQHTIVFVTDKDELVTKGLRQLTISDGTTWAQVKAMDNFPTITKTGYSIGSYYVYDGAASVELNNTTTFTYDTNTTLVVNISWTTAVYTITFENTDKTTFATGETGIRTANDGTSWDSVSKPVVIGSEDTTVHKRYVPNGKWYTDTSLTSEFKNTTIDKNIKLYAGYDVVTTGYQYTVNFVNAYGFEDGAKTTDTKTEQGTYKFTDFAAPTDKLIYPDQKSSTESTYTFKGWGIEDTTTIPEGTTNVYAQWEAKETKYYNVVFTSGEQVAWTGSQSFWFKTTDSSKTSIANIYDSIGTPTKTRSTLVGWKYTATKGGTSSTKSITVDSEGDKDKMVTAFKALKFAEIMDPDTTITFEPIFQEDTSTHLLYILSNDTSKGTVAAASGFSLLSYVDTTTTIGTIKSKIITSPATGYKVSKYRNAVTGTYFSDTDTITTDTVLVVDFVTIETDGSFQGKDWSEVAAACDTFEASAQDDAAAIALVKALTGLEVTGTGIPKTTLWNNLKELQGTVKVNGLEHTVKVIDCMHDDISEGGTRTGKKAAITFEFANLISDANGYSLATLWNDTKDTSSANYDYLNSSIRKAIDGQGAGTANWFEKSAATWSTTYATKSVIDMLPYNFTTYLKTVTKSVNIKNTSWTATDYDTNLFLLSPKEMGYSPSSYGGLEGTTYSYYSTSTSQTDEKRIKQQVKGTDGALTSETSVSGTAYGKGWSFAGYNASSVKGSICWLASPSTNTSKSTDAWYYSYDGYLKTDGSYASVYYYAHCVAPCFCI